uniref:SUN domain-containing protein n=1 Tax=Knipowitschia caucasica TaxID=637954 RepID=A0AAV2M4D4_KNICA
MFGYVAVSASEYAHPIDLRRSGRLQQQGYYRSEGRPSISYKETPYKVFNKRRRQPRSRQEEQLEDDNRFTHDAPEVKPRRRSSKYWMFLRRHFQTLCLFLFAATMTMTFGHLYHKADQDSYSRLLYKEGKQGPNYASLENGANVIIGQTSGTCRSPNWRECARTWFMPRQHHILQSCSPLRPGVCWPMAGDKDYVTIQLSQGIRVRHVTIGHIRKIQSPTKGLKWEDSEEEFLGSFIYDQNGPSFQTFGLQHGDPETVQQVRLHIKSNYGNKDFTCLYNVRVHGEF